MEDGTVLYFCGPRHGASYFKARQPIDQSKNKPIHKAWMGDPGFQVLINWWTTEGNWDVYCGGKGVYGHTKVSYCSELSLLINNTPGASKRTGEDVRKKIDDILVRFNKATDFLNATGQGILNNNLGCHEEKELKIKEYVKDKLLSVYYELESVMRSRPKTKALATNESNDLEDEGDNKK